MGCDQDGRAPGRGARNQLQDLECHLRIEVPGGLVGQEKLGLVHQCAGDRDPLLLSPESESGW